MRSLPTGDMVNDDVSVRGVPVPARIDDARRIALAVNRAAEFGFFRPRCLVKSRALRKMLDEAGLDGLDRNPHALRAAVGELDLDPLQVRTELAGSQAGNVRADAAALLGLTLTVDDLAHGRAFSGDCANSCHDVS